MSQLITLPLDQIIPYPENPRIIAEADINRVRASIERYGYRAKIIVDRDHVIVVGHTRRAALEALGYTEAEVIVTDLPPDKAAEYRIVDNRAAELATWDRDLLIPELREFVDQDHLALFFPEIDLSLDFSDTNLDITELDLERAQEALDARLRDSRNLRHRIIECPTCEHHFQVSG